MAADSGTGALSDGAVSAAAEPWRSRLGPIIRLPLRYWVSIVVFFAGPLATYLAARSLGDQAGAADIERLGYGWPALEAGRWWTPFTGAIVDHTLTVTFIPGYTFVAVVLLENKARHWRTAVTLVGGQVLGVLIGLALCAPLRGRTAPFAHEMTTTIDFGISVGGFACLGMWTGYLAAPWRRPLRWAVSCYLAAQLLLSGLIFDVSHPLGWTLGVVGGTWLMRPARPDPAPLRRPQDVWWIVLAVVLGSAVGIVAGWNGGGVGGIFGWGPGS